MSGTFLHTICPAPGASSVVAGACSDSVEKDDLLLDLADTLVDFEQAGSVVLLALLLRHFEVRARQIPASAQRAEHRQRFGELGRIVSARDERNRRRQRDVFGVDDAGYFHHQVDGGVGGFGFVGLEKSHGVGLVFSEPVGSVCR